MYQCQARPKYNILSQKIQKILTCVVQQLSSRCGKKILQRGRKVTKHGTADIFSATGPEHRTSEASRQARYSAP